MEGQDWSDMGHKGVVGDCDFMAVGWVEGCDERGLKAGEGDGSVRARINSVLLQKDTKVQNCGEKVTFLHCWYECKLVQPLWKRV